MRTKKKEAMTKQQVDEIRDPLVWSKEPQGSRAIATVRFAETFTSPRTLILVTGVTSQFV